MENKYAVKQLAKLVGVSVRALQLYDKMGLLKPSVRTYANYRLYSEQELLRLQQILFYKELDFPLKAIKQLLDNPNFNVVEALEGHKSALIERRNRLNTLLNTINKTVINLKNGSVMKNYEELYEGMPKENAIAWRQDAMTKWGEENVIKSEQALLNMPNSALEQLKIDQKNISKKLRELQHIPAESEAVQEQIALHYINILGFWGLTPKDDFKADRYKGLAELYVSDERYMNENGSPTRNLQLLCERL